MALQDKSRGTMRTMNVETAEPACDEELQAPGPICNKRSVLILLVASILLSITFSVLPFARRTIVHVKPKRHDYNEALLWSDEFDVDGPPDPSRWSFDIGVGDHGWGNNELQYYTDRNARVSNGTLRLQAILDDEYEGSEFTSARIKSGHDLAGDNLLLYGRIVVRARLLHCTALGTWPAIWMLPTDWVYGGWPSSGEIDIMEHVGFDTGRVHASIHTEDLNWMHGNQITANTITSVADWHEYEILWSKEKISFFLDGFQYLEYYRRKRASYTTWPFDQKFHILMNVAVGGNWGGLEGVNNTAFEGDGQFLEIDWVRVYGNVG